MMEINTNTMRFRDRRDAGRGLARALLGYADHQGVTVLGLPRGGVPVAYEVAKRLRAPLDVFLVRKLGVPGQEELAMGAIASGGIRVLNRDVIALAGLTDDIIDAVAAREERELERVNGSIAAAVRLCPSPGGPSSSSTTGSQPAPPCGRRPVPCAARDRQGRWSPSPPRRRTRASPWGGR